MQTKDNARPDTFIYGLVDPRTQLIRYVGQSGVGMARPRSHGAPATLARNKQHSGNWIREVQAKGLTYEIVVLEQTVKEELDSVEVWWIAYGRALGWPLTNHSIGGKGSRGRVMPEEEKKRRSELSKGRKFSDEHKAKIAAGAKVRWSSQEERNKQKVVMNKRWEDPAQREYAARKTKDYFEQNPEAKQRSAEVIRANWSDPETKAKMLEGRAERGRTQTHLITEEARQASSERMKENNPMKNPEIVAKMLATKAGSNAD